MAEIPPRDWAMLVKLMALTASNHDGEALTALRKAGALLARHHLTWPEVLNRTMSPNDLADLMREAADIADREEVDDAFDELLGDDGISAGGFRNFIENLASTWNQCGQLSPKQRAAVLTARDRHRFYRTSRARAHG